MSRHHEVFFAPCPRGLEELLGEELKQMGAKAVAPTAGGVEFSGAFPLCYQVNLESRLASRVLWRVHQGRYKTEQDVYRAAFRLPWGAWFSPKRTIKVKVSARQCPLHSLDYVTLRIKDAICDSFRASARVRPDVNTRLPDVRIDAFLEQSHLALYLDTSGEALFKRGYRKAVPQAPLRENLAAGILMLTGWTGREPLLDPMCGSGTFLIEAAHLMQRRPPGLGRHFAFEKLNCFDREAWDALCESRQLEAHSSAPLAIYGCDIDEKALQMARENVAAAGLSRVVKFAHADVLELVPPDEPGVLLTNLPYGVRTGEESDLAGFYPKLGDRLKQQFAGWRAYLFTADLRLPELIRLAPSRRTPLFNGALECRLYEFKLVQGGMRRHRGTARIARAKGAVGS